MLIERELLEFAHETARAYSIDLALREAVGRVGWWFEPVAGRVDALILHSEGEWIKATQALARFRDQRSVIRAEDPGTGFLNEGHVWDASGWGYDPDGSFAKLVAAAMFSDG